jgi:AhpD family alkylhydroperoxidase
MNSSNGNVSTNDNLRQQLASALGIDVQRLHVFFSLYENAFVQGALPGKVKHLIALAMAIGKRTSETIIYHVNAALQAGASRDEIREVVTVAVLVAGVTSFVSGAEALAAVARFEAQKLTSSSEPAAAGTHS